MTTAALDPPKLNVSNALTKWLRTTIWGLLVTAVAWFAARDRASVDTQLAADRAEIATLRLHLQENDKQLASMLAIVVKTDQNVTKLLDMHLSQPKRGK